jgi:hypothetical protein
MARTFSTFLPFHSFIALLHAGIAEAPGVNLA